MDTFRNLTGIQKGLLGGLILGVLVVYLCLCLSAVGVVPIIPQVRLGQSVAQAGTTTPISPTATSMSGALPAQPSPTLRAETATAIPTASATPANSAMTATAVVLSTETPAFTQTPVVIVVTSPPEATNPSQALIVNPTTGSAEAAATAIVMLVTAPASAAPQPTGVGGREVTTPASTIANVTRVGLSAPPGEPSASGEALAIGKAGVSGASTGLKKPEVTAEQSPIVMLLPTEGPANGMPTAARGAMRQTTQRLAIQNTLVPTPAATPVWTWQGIEYEHKPGAAGGPLDGVLAVRVVGVPDRKVSVREASGGWNTALVTGRKPQYGQFSDDVGGLPPGTYFIKPMDIDSEVQVKLNRGDFALVEFALRPPPGWTPQPTHQAVAAVAPAQPTPTTEAPQPPVSTQSAAPGVAPTPTEQGGWVWQGVEYERKPGAVTGAAAGILAVRVVGVPDRKVFIRENSGGWNTTLVTGQKPEYGQFSADVGGLAPGAYTVKPLDIDSQVQVKLDRGDFVLVEFSLRPPPNWTPQPPQPGTPQALAQAVTPKAPAQSAPTANPPQPPAPTQAMALGVAPTPTEQGGWVWQGIEYERKPGAATGSLDGVLAVRVVGVPDRKVFIRENSGGWNTTLVTGQKPEYGDFSTDVGGLAPGAYTIKPLDIDSQVQVKLDRGDFVLVEFSLRPRPDWTPQPPQAGTPQPPAQAVTPKAPVQSAPTANPPQPPAPTQAMALGVAPTPAEQGGWVWQGIEYERKPGAATGSLDGVLAVRVVGVPDRRVFIRENSGGWNATLVTGQKPEYGDFSTDVGGLAPGTYTVKPLDIDSEVQVKLDRGDFVLVEFALRPPPAWTPQPTQAAATVAESTAMPSPPAGSSATPTLVPGWTWLGSEIERKPAAQPGAPSGTLIVRAVALPDRQVIVREVSSGWTITAKTGSKLEGGAFVAPVEGLAPGTYAIRLADVPSETRVKLQAGEQVTVQFNPQPAVAR